MGQDWNSTDLPWQSTALPWKSTSLPWNDPSLPWKGDGAPAVPAPPANVSVPVISGSAVEGQALTASAGSWSGYPYPTFTYQWKRGGVNISGATAQAYTLVSADVGSTITVTVTATNASGSASATSAATDPVAGSGASLTAPVLSATVDGTSIDVTVTLTGAEEGDTVEFQIDDDPAFGSTSDTSDSVDAGEVTASEVTFTVGPLADGEYSMRARLVRGASVSDWSNVEPVTIATAPAGHRYWRINVTDTVSESAMEWMEVELLVGGVDQTGSGTASASSFFNIFVPSQAFDDDTGTRWASDFSGTWPQWLAYDFGSGVSKDIDEVTIATANQDRSPAAFDVQYSDDGASWTTLWSVSGLVLSDWTAGTPKAFARP